MLMADSNKRRNAKKKTLGDTGLDLEEVTYGGPTF